MPRFLEPAGERPLMYRFVAAGKSLLLHLSQQRHGVALASVPEFPQPLVVGIQSALARWVAGFGNLFHLEAKVYEVVAAPQIPSDLCRRLPLGCQRLDLRDLGTAALIACSASFL